MGKVSETRRGFLFYYHVYPRPFPGKIKEAVGRHSFIRDEEDYQADNQQNSPANDKANPVTFKRIRPGKGRKKR